MPLVSRTRATFRSAGFGFFGVWVNTRTQTPRFCGLFCSAGLLVLLTIFLRPARTNWLIVGIAFVSSPGQSRGPAAGTRRRLSTGQRPDDQLTALIICVPRQRAPCIAPGLE